MSSSSRLSLIFSCIGHAYIHIFTAFFFVIVLALEIDWQQPYHELLELWTVGALLVGLAASPAGWLGDRWSPSGMIAVFFIGMGICSILAGFSSTPVQLLLSLAGIGLFAAIYHPVGIPWLVRNGGANRGKLLGLNGVFGSLGAALAGLIAGGLIDISGWRTAFIVPGIISCLTGLALKFCLVSGRIIETNSSQTTQPSVSRRDRVKVFAILLITMFAAGIIFHSTQISLPKVFALRHDGLIGEGALGIGVLVATVYGAAAIMQLGGGWLADRYPLKWVYVFTLAMQIPFLYSAASLGGVSLVIVAMIMVMCSVSALPAENLLLAHYTPADKQGVAFGIKFVLSFGAGPVAVQLVARINEYTGGFYAVFATLAVVGVIVVMLATLLPVIARAQPVHQVTG